MTSARQPKIHGGRVVAALLAALLCAACPAQRPRPAGPVEVTAGEAGRRAAPDAAALRFGVVSSLVKVRPEARPTTAAQAELLAARNEHEAFQVVLWSDGAATADVSLALAEPLRGPRGAQLPAENVVLFREAYYAVRTPSFAGGAAGRWPDPLIPDVDTSEGERRRAFPLSVPATERRAVWVDVLVPQDARPGSYRGALAVRVAGREVGRVPIALRVGRFALPSTATLVTAVDMDFDQPCRAHTGHESCAAKWDERAASVLRERYVRLALEHRVSIVDPFFQPPFDESAGPFEEHLLPLVLGTSPRTRLPGARLTAVRLTAEKPAEIKRFLSYAKRKGFAAQLFFLSGDEPTDEHWARAKELTRAVRAAAPGVRVALPTSLAEARQGGAVELPDVLVPVINVLDANPMARGGDDPGQLAAYQAWARSRPGRALWTYLSCRSYGCGKCGASAAARDAADAEGGEASEASGASEAAGGAAWPARVIDASAVQNRALPWLAYSFGLGGERYFDAALKLGSAWEEDGLCWSSGAGEGTLLYPGQPARIGGRTDVPLPSIRLKLMREGLEDYEYLVLAAQRDAPRARALARALFPHAYAADPPPERLLRARAELWELIDGAAGR